MKSMLLIVTEKLLLYGKPQMARRAAAFSDHLVKFRWDGVVGLVEDNTVHPYPPWIIGRSVIHDVSDEGVALKSLLHEVTLASIVGGGGVEDDVHQLADIEDRGHLMVEVGDDRVFIGQSDKGDELRGIGWRRWWRGWHALPSSGSRLFHGGGLGLIFFKEESGGMNVVTRGSYLLLGVLDLLDDGLKPSPESSDVSIVWHGDRRRWRWPQVVAVPYWGRMPVFGAALLRIVTVGTHKTPISCTNMSCKCIK
jgi:hypothetical protein